MAILIRISLLAGGFFLLILGAELLVRSSSDLARRYGVSELVIGLTIVAFGTSSPELTVNIFSAVNGTNSITIGNIVGSNIFNILVILGISSLIYPLQVKKTTTWIEIPLCLLSGVALLISGNDFFIDGSLSNDISRTDGLLLLLFFAIFLAYSFYSMKVEDSELVVATSNYDKTKLVKIIGLLLSGFIMLFLGGRLIVDSSVFIAEKLGVSERIIGLTIISMGTSLPELAASAVAAYRKKTDIAIGNIVGSNIFNVFFVLGLSAVISPISVGETSFIFDMFVNLFASILLFIFIFTGGGRKIQRWEGILFLTLYAFFLINILF